jgi:hypothetical protein
MAAKRRMLAAAMVVATLASAAMAIEEPAFKPELREGAFELRDYPALVVAEVTVTGDQKEAASKGFRLLAGYIFGGNKGRQSIAMTAPVAQTQTSSGAWVVRFTMPRAYTLQTLPVPDDARVKLRDIEPARFSVLQFSGLAKPADVEARSKDLLALVESHRLRAIGSVSLAQYNPPWTLWFLRRNEVMVEVER